MLSDGLSKTSFNKEISEASLSSISVKVAAETKQNDTKQKVVTTRIIMIVVMF